MARKEVPRKEYPKAILRFLWATAFLAIVVTWWAARRAASTANSVSFNQTIQPILSENCYACHGPDPGARKAGLRLDRAEFAFVSHEKYGPGRVNTVGRSGPANPDSTCYLRPDWYASLAGRSGRICGRRIRECLRESSGPAAGESALRRASRPLLAGCSTLWRHARAAPG